MTDARTRFWSKVDKSGQCWLWIAHRNAMGYGQLRVSGRAVLAHRFSWFLAHGAEAGDLCVLHRCDTPACVNPSHLFLGTRTDNAIDKVRKGRQSRTGQVGSKNPVAKLTEADVATMRGLHARGHSGGSIARRFGISKTTACRVIRGDRWRHVP